MAQIFSSTATFGIRLAMLGAAVCLSAVGVVAYRLMDSPAQAGDALPQPLPFSHKHHVGDDGIDCRYCHASVERSAHAGLPASRVCMSCHSQLFGNAAVLEPLRESYRLGQRIKWNRVHRLPDFVFFDHSIHVAKGVACVECHGRVDRMVRVHRVARLEMQWCLACHRDPAPHLRPPDKVFDMGWQPPRGFSGEALMGALQIADRRRLTDCSTCHR